MGKNILSLHNPTLWSVLASVGVVATTATAIKATSKAAILLDERKQELASDKLKPLEVIKTTWKIYAPTVALGASTIVCIMHADGISKNRQIFLTSAYSMLNQTYREYQNKVRELYGEETHQNIKEAIILDRCKKVEIFAPSFLEGSSLDICTNEPEITRTFYDRFSNRYFESTLSDVIRAEYHFNRNYILRGYAHINEFYEFLGIDTIENVDELGWSADSGIYWIDFDHGTIKMNDDLEVIYIDAPFGPEPFNMWD